MATFPGFCEDYFITVLKIKTVQTLAVQTHSQGVSELDDFEFNHCPRSIDVTTYVITRFS